MYSVYLVTNKANGKIYIGYTKGTPEWRFYLHVKSSRNKTKSCHFANAIRKYGPDGFKIDSIDTAETEKDAKALEKKYILERKSYLRAVGYNLTMGGEGGSPTEEVRLKLSFANRGKVRTPEMRKKVADARRGIKTGPRSEAHKANMSRILKGRFLGEDHPTWVDIPVEEAVSLYRSGLSVRDIGKRLGTTGHTVRARLKSAGVERRPRWTKSVQNLKNAHRRGAACSWAKLTQVEVEEIRDLAAHRVMPQHQIARAYGVCQMTVSCINIGRSWKK